jgi:hypothetical protein
LALFLAFTVVGCGKSLEQKAAEKYIEARSGGNVDIKDDGFSIKDEQGNEFSLQQGKELPEGWPSKVPYYKKGGIDQSSVMSLPGGKTFSVVILTDDSIEDIADYYKDEFEKENFNKNLEMNSDGSSLLGFEDDDLSVSIGISSDSGQQEITQTIVEKTKE